MFAPEDVKKVIENTQHLVVFTGAGVSAESGVPTFRDALTGLWENFDAEALATPEAFAQDPAFVWGWYEWRRKLLLEVEPNPAHFAIAELAKRVPKFTLITQNVDDLHERAGSTNVLHLHGSLFTPRCFDCGNAYQFTAAPQHTVEQAITPPQCSHCSGHIRPGVVWFGESLPETEFKAAFEAVQSCDLLLSVGTSGMVYPAAQLPEIAAQNNATVVHVNPQKMSAITRHGYSLQGAAGEILPLLV